MNSRSIGIEITHKTGVEYPVAQIDGVVDLVSLLKRAYPEIPAGRVVGHSDIGLCDPNSSKPCSPREPRRLGRKSTDPGSAFPWERIEALGLSFQIADGVVNPEMYGGFFQMVPGGKLHSGDSDHQHRYGGQIRPSIRGAVQWLQKDLEKIGYFCPPDGDYGIQTAMAVQMFQQHIFSGSRRTGAPDHFNSGDGSLDMRTAELIKRVLNEVELTTGA
jgi:N-acetyl-anhydromuramyl-L-alanine amidase AmpD